MNDEKQLIQLWQQQPVEPKELNMELVMQQADRFQRKIKNRNLREYLACVGLVAWTGYTVLGTDDPLLVKLGALLIALGCVAIGVTLRLKGHAHKHITRLG